MRVLIQHHSLYRYPSPAALGPHLIRLRPANHTKARIESYALQIAQDSDIRWQQDPYGNHVARALIGKGERVPALDISVELAVEIRPINPFDFFTDEECEDAPFAYPSSLRVDVSPFLDREHASFRGGKRFLGFLAELPARGRTVPLIVEINRLVNQWIKYVIRDDPGIWTPEETLEAGRGSCRDMAVLLVAALRSRGLAARFASGYLVQLKDEGMIPDEPKGVSRDVVDLHAWAEVFIPGGGWIGLDPTSGLLAGEGHIPLACTAVPALAAPIEGTSDTRATGVHFESSVGRLGHEPRPTEPYEERVWQALLAAGDRVDQAITSAGLVLTSGGEPTFNSREHPSLPEWNGAALGATKTEQGLRLIRELTRRFAPGGVVIARMGKHYPGESLPRWALDLWGRADGGRIWSEIGGRAGAQGAAGAKPRAAAAVEHAPAAVQRAAVAVEHAAAAVERAPQVGARAIEMRAQQFAEALAERLGARDALMPAYEDPWRFLQAEASLPIDVDPLLADLDEPKERRRLARVLDRGLGREVGFVLPLARRRAPAGSTPVWTSEPWSFRRGHLFLVPGDSPIGLRLPLGSLPPAPVPEPASREGRLEIPDPRRRDGEKEREAASQALERDAGKDRADESQQGVGPAGKDRAEGSQQGVARCQVKDRPEASKPAADRAAEQGVAGAQGAAVRTALCVEPREDRVFVFLPPLESAEDFLALIEAIDHARVETGVDVALEGYPPPRDPSLFQISIAPDPGVLEVNMPPQSSLRDYASTLESVFDAALHAGLHSEKYLLDGRMAGSGGGHHLTLGGPAALESPFVKRPDLLASLLTFLQHHPSLSYMFSGLFVGPTSQAPRVDEARHDSLYDLEIALDRAFLRTEEPPAPWLSDLLFRHLLVDLAGNTHRAEVSIDKLFDWQTPHGRQGLIELRAFEMTPHIRMAVAQILLVRSLIAAFAKEPYRAPLVRWGQELHDRFLLPFWMWRDFEDVLGYLRDRGLELPADGYRPFIELRCPLAGRLETAGVVIEVRNAIEPWNVLGEELTSTGTSRFVDSSMERIEVRAVGMVEGRHALLVNGHVLPLRATGMAGERVGGVRFRAWAPAHSLHAHIGIHHPIRIDLLDRWGRRSLGACAYHVWHPEGRGFITPPLTRFEAAARRAQRFTIEGQSMWPVEARAVPVSAEAPYTVDLRRVRIDRPPPKEEEGEG